VLVVDDEPMIREFLVKMLQLDGHKVLTAEDGREALAIASAPDGDDIDLLITDLGMSGMSGTTLATEMRAIRPDIKTLFVSGETAADISAMVVAFPESAWLRKPFHFRAIGETIQSLFESEPALVEA
jgi:DNA-binding response OmpR family regulator